MDLALIDAGGANLGSVRYACARLGVPARVVRTAKELAGATHVILPGVGAAPQAMAQLRAQGLIVPLQQLQVPLLGICLGMQLLFEHSEEGNIACLGMIPGQVRALLPSEGIRIPHIGWNRLHPHQASPLTQGMSDGAYAYFVHRYAVPVVPETIARCHHGTWFSAMVQHGHFYGAQFHPERSAQIGAQVLKCFLQEERICP